MTMANTAVWCMWKLREWIPRVPTSRKKTFFSFLFLELYEVMDAYCGNYFTVHVSQIIMLHALNLYGAACQLYLTKTCWGGNHLWNIGQHFYAGNAIYYMLRVPMNRLNKYIRQFWIPLYHEQNVYYCNIFWSVPSFFSSCLVLPWPLQQLWVLHRRGPSRLRTAESVKYTRVFKGLIGESNEKYFNNFYVNYLLTW